MFRREKHTIAAFVLSFIVCTLCFISITPAQDETDDAKIIERYKLMLSRKPKEGSTFDRLYQFYLEGAGLDTMVSRLSGRSTSETGQSELPTYPWTHLQTLWKGPRGNQSISTRCYTFFKRLLSTSRTRTHIYNITAV